LLFERSPPDVLAEDITISGSGIVKGTLTGGGTVCPLVLTASKYGGAISGNITAGAGDTPGSAHRRPGITARSR
jgi:hypothetical protein